MDKQLPLRPGDKLRAAKQLSDFFTGNNFTLYRNYCPTKPVADQYRSKVLYDRSCPICRSEMHRLKARDKHHRITLIDISAERFDPDYWGFPLATLSAAIHVQRPDGRWLIGMAALRHVYSQVGLGWLMAPSGWPLLSRLADRLYASIAPNRQAVSRWLGLQSHNPCNDALCDSKPAADTTPPEDPRHVQHS